MPTPPNHVKLYDKLQNIETSVPYAMEDSLELDLVIPRFVSFARMIAVNRNIAAPFGDRSTTHVQLATDLRIVLKASRQNPHYPNVVLPMSKYFAVKVLTVISRSIATEPLPGFFQQEIQK